MGGANLWIGGEMPGSEIEVRFIRGANGYWLTAAAAVPGTNGRPTGPLHKGQSGKAVLYKSGQRWAEQEVVALTPKDALLEAPSSWGEGEMRLVQMVMRKKDYDKVPCRSSSQYGRGCLNLFTGNPFDIDEICDICFDSGIEALAGCYVCRTLYRDKVEDRLRVMERNEDIDRLRELMAASDSGPVF